MAEVADVPDTFLFTSHLRSIMIRSIILGSAAGLVALGSAQAADLPVKAKPVEYVRICSLYGAGFFYIPGTDTCIKLGGFVRIDTTFNGTFYDGPAWSGDLGAGTRYRTYFSDRNRMGLTVDTRTATEYGVVRTFGQGDFNFTTLGINTANPATLAVLPPGALLDSAGGGYVSVEFVFIQFAGFTFGKSSSAFATPWHSYLGNNSSNFLGGHDSVTGVNNIQYSAQFGNGVSATIGLEDPTVYNRTSLYNLSTGLAGSGLGANAYGGTHAPDLVGNIRISQEWGLFQLSGALHEVNASYNSLTVGTAAPTALSELSGHPDTRWGGAVSAALQIKNLPTGPGDDVKFDVTYARGDTKQVISTSSTSPNFAMFGNSGLAGAYRSIGFGVATDGLWLPGATGIELTTAMGFRAALNHNWDPYWSTSLWGGYSAVRYTDAAKTAYCATYAATAIRGPSAFTCNPDYNVAQLGIVTRWTPVKNLTLSAEILYFNLDQKFQGSATLGPSAPLPTAVYEFKDQNTVALNLRVQRNF